MSESGAVRKRPAVVRFALAVSCIAVALGLSLLQREIEPTTLFLAAVMLATWFGGKGPGLLAVVLATLTVDYFFTAPLRTLGLGAKDVSSLVVFALSALFIAWISATRKRAETALRAARDDLDARVRERTASLIETNERLQVEVADRMRAEEESRTLASLVEHSTDFIGFASLEGRVLFVNPAGQKLVGLDGDEQARATTLFDYVVEQERESFQQQVLPAVIQQGHWEGETRFRHFKTGTQIPMLQHVFLITGQSGDHPARLATISRDITERKRAEEELRKRASLLDLTHDTVFVRDRNDVITYWNRGAEERYGWAREEAVGNVSHQLLRTVFPAPLDEINAALLGTGHWEGELIHTTRDGTSVVVASRWSLQRDDHGNPVAILETNNDITERKRAEEAVRRRETYLAESQRQSRTGTWGWNPVSGDDFWSDEFFRIFGYDPEATRPSYRAVMHRIHPADKPSVEQTLGRSASERKDSEFEYRIVLSDGSIKHIYSLGQPVVNESGDLTEYVITVSDVTERRRADAELRESERRYRHIFQTAGVSLWEEDFSLVTAAIDDLRARGVRDVRQYLAAHPEFVRQAISMVKIIDVNDATVRLFRAQSKDELLVSLHKVFTPETQEVFAGELIALAEGQTSFESETVLRALNGDEKAVLFTITFPPQPDKLDSVLVSIMDITERKRAEEAVRRQANMLDQTHDAVLAWEFPSTIVYWNRGAERLYGFSREEAVGRRSHELLRTQHPMPIPLFEAMLERERAWAGELTQTTRDGRRIIVESRQTLIREADGRQLVLETNRDITERKRAEEALQRAQAELAHVTRVMTMGEITASIAHEVNQPLTAIIMNGNACRRWLAANPPNLDEVREAVQRIVNDGNRASQVIGRIRTLLKKEMPQKRKLQLNDIIRETLTFTRSELTRHQVSVRADLCEDLPSVMGDRVQLQQVLMNLILNAIDAMAEVTQWPRTLTVRSRAEESGDVLVEVQDSGKGLDAEHMTRIFDPFFSTKPGGLGMGLAISRSIVEAHGGRLWATPHGGPGLTMRFTLPLEAGGGE